MEVSQVDESEKEVDSFDYLSVLSNSLILRKIIEKVNSYKDLRNLKNSCRSLRNAFSELHYKYKNLWYYYEYEDNLVVSMRQFLSTIDKFRYCIECINFYDETVLMITINEMVTRNGRNDQNGLLNGEKMNRLNDVINEYLPVHTSLNLAINQNFDLTNLTTLKDFKHVQIIYITKPSFSYKYLEFIKKNVGCLDKIVFGESRCLLDSQSIIPGIYLNDVTNGIQIFKFLFSYTGLLSMIRDDVKLKNIYLTHGAVDCIESANEFEVLRQFTQKSERVHLDIYLNGFRNPSSWVDYFRDTTNIHSLTWFVSGYLDTSFIFSHQVTLEFMETVTNYGIIYFKDLTSIPDLIFTASISSEFFDALRNCYKMEKFAMTLYFFEISESLSDEVIDRRTHIVYKNSFTEFCCKLPPKLTLLYLDHCDILSFDELQLISQSSPHIETLILHDLRDCEICDLDKLKLTFKNVRYVDFTVAEKYASSIVLRSLTCEKQNENGEKILVLKWPSFDIFTCKFLCDVKGLNNGFKELEKNTIRVPGRFIVKTPRRRNDDEFFYNIPSSHHEEYNEVEITIMKYGSLFEQRKYVEIKQYIDSMSFGKIGEFQRRYL